MTKPLIITGQINWSVARDVIEFVRNNDDEIMSVVIGSSGGDVRAGLSIYQELRRWENFFSYRKVETRVTGYACSMAAVIALAGTFRKINSGAYFILHHTWRTVNGNYNSNQLMKTMNLAKSESNDCFDIITNRTKIDRELLEHKTQDGDWIIPDSEALELGLATQIVNAK